MKIPSGYFLFLAWMLSIFAPVNINVFAGCAHVCINNECQSSCLDDVSIKLGQDVKKETEEYSFSSFHSIVSDFSVVRVMQGEAFKVLVSADAQHLDDLNVFVKEGILYAEQKSNSSIVGGVKIFVTMPSIRSLTHAGVADITVDSFQLSEMVLKVKGTGKVVGSRNIIDHMKLFVEGTVSVDMSHSEVVVADVQLSGAAKVNMSYAGSEGQLYGEISDVSRLTYCGNPGLNIRRKGIAKIERLMC